MIERPSARLILLDPQDRLFLFKVHQPTVYDPADPHYDPFWIMIGGLVDPGEDYAHTAVREAREETGLGDLVPWPDTTLRHVVVCYVRPSATEPEHEHADLRYLLATRDPDATRPENPDSPLRWLDFTQARSLVGTNNLRHTLDRAERLLNA